MKNVSLTWLILLLTFAASIKADILTENTLASKSEKALDPIYNLVVYQIQNSDAQHLLVIIDTSFSATGSIVRAAFSKTIPVTVWTYEGGKLSEYLASFYASSLRRKDILLACSQNTTLSVFKEVNRRRLEAYFFKWFVLTETSMDSLIIPLLYEENQVTIFEGSVLDAVRIKAMEWSVEGELSFEDVKKIYPSQQLEEAPHAGLETPPLFPPFSQKYEDMQGRVLKVAANNHIVFFRQRTLENGELAPWEGVDVNIVKELSRTYNFTYEIMHPADGRWGGPSSDGTISGLIGTVARHEAHMAIHEITITEIRETVVDFTRPYYTEGSTLVSKAPELKNLALAVVTPFSFSVWGLILCSLFIIGLTVMIIDVIFISHVSKKGQETSVSAYVEMYFSYYLMNMFRTFVIQGNKLKSTSSSFRVILGLWFLICIIINALYSGNLCAVFAAPSYVDPINSLLDLLKALKEGSVYPITTAETAMADLFQRATFGTHYEIYRYFDPQRTHVGYDERFEKTAEGLSVILSSRTSNIIKTNIYGRVKYHVGTEQFFYQSYGIAVATGSPLQIVFSKVLQNLIEAGLIEKWVNEAVTNELLYIGIRGGDKGNLLSRQSTGNKAISIVQLQTAFFILGAGMLLATISLVFEIIIGKRN